MSYSSFRSQMNRYLATQPAAYAEVCIAGHFLLFSARIALQPIVQTELPLLSSIVDPGKVPDKKNVVKRWKLKLS